MGWAHRRKSLLLGENPAVRLGYAPRDAARFKERDEHRPDQIWHARPPPIRYRGRGLEGP
jgi:hypothetical protein